MKYKREIERKYVIPNLDYHQALTVLTNIFSPLSEYEGVSTDTFWMAPDVDFVRLRENTKELTVKITDNDSIEDRLEENIVVGDYDTARRFACATFGLPVGTLEKTFLVLELGNGATISLYEVTGDDRLFLEVEAESLTDVIEIEEVLREDLILVQQDKSLFNLIFGDSL
jgi:hypothetical protein